MPPGKFNDRTPRIEMKLQTYKETELSTFSMGENSLQAGAHEYSTIIVALVCGIIIAFTAYGIPTLKGYYRRRRYTNAQVSNIIKYNSLTDPRELFLYNFNLSDITVRTGSIGISYGRCLKTCSMKKKLRWLTMTTNDTEKLRMSVYEIDLMPNLTFLILTIEDAKYWENDYLLPIIQNARNIESLLYQNGHLSAQSMCLLTQLPKLDFLILENIGVTDPKAFSIMLFNLKVRQLAYQLKYGIY